MLRFYLQHQVAAHFHYLTFRLPCPLSAIFSSQRSIARLSWPMSDRLQRRNCPVGMTIALRGPSTAGCSSVANSVSTAWTECSTAWWASSTAAQPVLAMDLRCAEFCSRKHDPASKRSHSWSISNILLCRPSVNSSALPLPYVCAIAP